MKESNVALTETDRLVLASYCDMIDGLSQYLGSAYEFVLHSLEDMDRSVIKIINGFHTGRKVGAPITDLALSMLSRIEEDTRNDSPRQGRMGLLGDLARGLRRMACELRDRARFAGAFLSAHDLLRGVRPRVRAEGARRRLARAPARITTDTEDVCHQES